MRWRPLALLLGVVFLLGLPLILSLVAADGNQGPDTPARERHFQVRGHQWAWEVQEGPKWDFSSPGGPARMVVEKGDIVVLHLLSIDVAHGFALPAYDQEARIDHVNPVELRFVADREGRFTFRCYLNCGNQHPYMVGEFVVRPDPVLPVGLWGVVVLGMAGVAWGLGRSEGSGEPGGSVGPGKVDPGTDRAPWSHRWLKDRRPQLALQFMMLGGFAFAIFAGLAGLQNGAHNLAVVAVWLVWWFLLVAVAVPLTGRAWCGICPLPLPGEWLARRRFLAPVEGSLPADRRLRWPFPKAGMWLSLGLLLTMAATSMVLTTSPRVTALILAGIWLLASMITLRYRGRTFCRHLCPISPFLSLYGRLAPLTLKVHRSPATSKTASSGSLGADDESWGCSWQRYPPRPDDNASCGYCLECWRSSAYENTTLRLRSPWHGLLQSRLKVDEVFAAAMLISLLLTYQLVMLGPYPKLKDAAGMNDGLLSYVMFIGLLAGLVVVVPTLLWAVGRMAHRLGRGAASEHQLRSAGALGLLPFGLASWIAFKLPVILNSWYYLPRILSDPLGWGWDLFGTANYPSTPLFLDQIPYLQVGLVLTGLVLGNRLMSARLDRHIEDPRALFGAVVPFSLYLAALAALLIRLFGG